MRTFKFLLLTLAILVAPIQNSYSALSTVDKAALTPYSKNLLLNAGFESSKSDWTISAGTFNIITSGTNFSGQGASSGQFVATGGAGRTLSTVNKTILAQSMGAQTPFTGGCFFKPQGASTYKVSIFDGSTELGTQSINGDPSGTTWFPVYAQAQVPASTTTLKLVITSVSASEPTLNIDDCYLGQSAGFTLIQFTQATMVGTALQAAGTGACTYAENTSSGLGSSWVDLAAASGCNAWTTTGILTAVGNNDHRMSITNLQPGDYKITLGGFFSKSATNVVCYRLSDGTNTSNTQCMDSSTNLSTPSLVFKMPTYTTATSNVTWKVQASDTISGTASWDNNTTGLTANWMVERFPTAPQQAAFMAQTPASWSGYTTVAGGCATTSTTYADPSACTSIAVTQTTNRNFGTVSTAGSSLPGVTFTPPRVGIYGVCALVTFANSTVNAGTSARLVDGAAFVIDPGRSMIPANTGSGLITLCGDYNVLNLSSLTFKVQIAAQSGTSSITNGIAAGSSAVQWEIHQKDAPMPAPVPLGNTPYGQWYHDDTCAFARTNTALGASAADTTCGFTQIASRNISVSSQLSGSDKLPGIVVVPTKAAVCNVTANVNILCATGGAVCRAELSDGTTSYDTKEIRDGAGGGANFYGSMSLQGIASVTGTTTFRVNTSADSGTITLLSNIGSPTRVINWIMNCQDP